MEGGQGGGGLQVLVQREGPLVSCPEPSQNELVAAAVWGGGGSGSGREPWRIAEGLDPLPGPLQPFCLVTSEWGSAGKPAGAAQILGVPPPGLPALS